MTASSLRPPLLSSQAQARREVEVLVRYWYTLGPAERLRLLRQVFGVTRDKLSEASRIGLPRMDRLFNGLARPTVDELHRLRVALGVDVATVTAERLGGLDPAEAEADAGARVVCAEVAV